MSSKTIKPQINNSFCAQPWVGLQVAADRKIRPCCMFSGDLGLYENDHSLKVAYNSFTAQNTKKQMLQGLWPKECLTCKQEEAISGTSPRIFSPHLDQSIEEHEKKLSFKKIEFFFSNVCNLDCVMCSPVFSSKWNTHIDDINSMNINFSKMTQQNQKRLNKDDISSLLDRCEEAEEVILIGGEPFACEESLYFLSEWKKRGYKARLRITSNGTLLGKKQLDELASCGNSLLSLSIDGTEGTYEWIRGFSWDKVEKNILSATNYPFRLVLNPTIGLFNILNLNDLIKFSSDNSLEINIGHFIRQPDYQSVLNLSLEIRENFAANFDGAHAHDQSNFLHALRQPQLSSFDENFIKLNKWITFFDKKRSLQFYKIHPEIKSLMEQSL